MYPERNKGGEKMTVERYGTLKGLLVQKGIKQEELANKIGMDRTTFNIKINRYKGRDFTLSEAIAISNAIEEPIDNFFWSKSILKETKERSKNGNINKHCNFDMCLHHFYVLVWEEARHRN